MAQLLDPGTIEDEGLLEHLLAGALAGLQHYAPSGELQASADYRLAFRELGLAIGLEALRRLHAAAARSRPALCDEVRVRLDALMHYVPLGDEIEAYWRDPGHRRASTWSEHRDINEVMLATRLVPEGFLVLAWPD